MKMPQKKATCLCLAVVVASLLMVPIAVLGAWAVDGGVSGWVASVAFHVAYVAIAVALYRRWVPRMNAEPQ